MLHQIKNDPEPCRMRNAGGSELGTCECRGPKDCPNPPQFSPMGMLAASLIDRFLAKVETNGEGGVVPTEATNARETNRTD